MGLIDQMLANLYKPPKQEKTTTILPKNLTPAKVENMLNQPPVFQGQLLRGQVLDLRANQIMVLLENGATVSARTEGSLELSIGQNAKFLVSQTSEEQIILKLFKEETEAENPMIDKALKAANIQKTERSVSIVTELLNHQQPINEAGIRHYLSLSAKYPELPVKNLILMELHHIPVTKENVEQFANYQEQNAKLLTQAQNMLQNLAKTINQLPEGPAKQEVLNELRQMLGNDFSVDVSSANVTPADISPADVSPSGIAFSPIENFFKDLTEPEQKTDAPIDLQNAAKETEHPVQTFTTDAASITATDQTVPGSITPDTTPSLPVHTAEPLIQSFWDSFLLKPEEVAEPDKVQKFYDKLNETLEKLEQLSQKVSEQSPENNVAGTSKQMRQNLSFMEAVNNVFPYIQLPLKFRDAPAHGELYVYEKKKALKPSDTLSALLHLELEALGTTDIYVTLAGSHVTTRFSMTDKASGNLIRTEMPKLTEALAAKGYTLQSEVSVRDPEDQTKNLLEQFLEEHAPGGLNRYTFDIRA